MPDRLHAHFARFCSAILHPSPLITLTNVPSNKSTELVTTSQKPTNNRDSSQGSEPRVLVILVILAI